MRLRGDGRLQLEVISHAALHAARRRQNPVVKTLPAPQPVALQVKRHAGNQNQIKLVQRDFFTTRRRFRDTQSSPKKLTLPILTVMTNSKVKNTHPIAFVTRH